MNITRRGMLTAGVAATAMAATVARGQDLGPLAYDFGREEMTLPSENETAPGISHRQGISDRPYVALTFDDGPHPTLTPRLLDMLKAADVRATFYVIGMMVEAYPDVLRRIVAEGHEVGNHTWRHPFLSRHGDNRVVDELGRTSDVLDRLVRYAPNSMRPPYGAITAHQQRLAYDRFGMETVLWSVDTGDWRRPGTSVVAQRAVNWAHGGAIILAHDIHEPTVAAMPAAIEGLKNRGFGFLTVSEVLGDEPPRRRFDAPSLTLM